MKLIRLVGKSDGLDHSTVVDINTGVTLVVTPVELLLTTPDGHTYPLPKGLSVIGAFAAMHHAGKGEAAEVVRYLRQQRD